MADYNTTSLTQYTAPGVVVSPGTVAAYLQETKTGQKMLKKAQRNAVEMFLINKVLEHEQQLAGDLRENGRYVYLQSLMSGEGMLQATTGRVHDRLQTYIDRDDMEHMLELQDTNRRGHQARLAAALQSILPGAEPGIVTRIAERLNGRGS